MQLRLFIAVFALLVAACGAANAQGYSGLIPDNKQPESKAEKSQNSCSQAGTCSATDLLISKPQPKQQSAQPVDSYKSAKTAQDLEAQARYKSYTFTPDSLDRETLKQIRANNSDYKALYKPSTRINGLLPMENTIKTMIEDIMTQIKNPELSQVERDTAGKNGYQKLLMMTDAMISSSTTPDAVYKSMNLPDIYIKEEREAATNGLKRLRAALSDLQAYK
jgi:hypothetical protein